MTELFYRKVGGYRLIILLEPTQVCFGGRFDQFGALCLFFGPLIFVIKREVQGA